MLYLSINIPFYKELLKKIPKLNKLLELTHLPRFLQQSVIFIHLWLAAGESLDSWWMGLWVGVHRFERTPNIQI